MKQRTTDQIEVLKQLVQENDVRIHSLQSQNAVWKQNIQNLTVQNLIKEEELKQLKEFKPISLSDNRIN